MEYFADDNTEIELLGRPQSEETKKRISKAMLGKKNPAWKGGVHQDYYRRITGAKKGDLVHHKDGNRRNGSKSNLVVIKKKDRYKHDELHLRGRNFHK